MSEKEYKEIEDFKKYLESIKTDASAKMKYLQAIGVLDAKGKHTQEYNECIQILAS